MAAIEPFMNISPGDLIKEELKYYGWTQKDLAGIIGISEKHLSKIINSNTAISNDIAKSLSQIFKQSPEFWLKAEYDYRERLKERNSEADKEEAIRIKAGIYRYMPIQQMIKLGWLSEWKNVDDLVKQVKIFWRKMMNNTEYSELTKGQPLWWRCLYPLLNISLTVLVAIMTYEIIKVNNINYYLKAFIVILYLIMFLIRLMFSIVLIMLMITKTTTRKD